VAAFLQDIVCFTPLSPVPVQHIYPAVRAATCRSNLGALEALGSRRLSLSNVRVPSAALRTTSTVSASTNSEMPTPEGKQEQKPEDSSRTLEALRVLRAQKLAAGETVFFDVPAIIGGDECAPEDAQKPLLLYLTGMDGLGVSAEPQFKDLSRRFEVRRLQVLAQDRRSFDELVAFVLTYINDWQARSAGKNGKVMLLGESFGGLLASGVAITNQTQLQGVMLANPATSFDRTDWPTFGPLLASIPSRLPLSDTRLKDLVMNAPGADALLKLLPLPVPDKSVGELAYAAVAGGALFVRALDQKVASTLLNLATGQGEQIVTAAQAGQLSEKLQTLSSDSLLLLDALLATLPPDAVAHR
jgi:pimeloyl-ACP methyl ester carboxylesterase